MSGRASVGWQTALADLSLILFMITAAAVSRQPARAGTHQEGGGNAAAASATPSPQAEPLAVYVDAPGAPPLPEWLAQQTLDPRQQVTITARYGAESGAQERAIAAAARLLYKAGRAGRAARVVVEPGEGPPRIVVAFDSPPAPERVGAQPALASHEMSRSMLAGR
ncbi:MAG TPA: hypothetical protein VJQ77_06560 [Novosphingobium sp.]|nr:hypothetical protein [Novosphingobium sp.]